MNPVRLRAIREAGRVGLRQFSVVCDNSCESLLEFITQHCAVFSVFCKNVFYHCEDDL